MPKPDSAEAPSLLPYLNLHSPGMALKLDFPDPSSSDKVQTTGDPCGPFTTIRNGKIVLDGRNQITDVTVLCQADTYLLNASELNPITNPDVESAWQQAWSKIQKAKGSRQSEIGTTVLPSQLDADGGLIALKPLYYCNHVDRFGHPHCPYCGADLELCREDDDLLKAGLPTYSRSLQRYLYCPACHRASDDVSFYQHPLAMNAPARVQGCHALIKDFSRLLAKTELANDLPCIGCSQASVCYGPETLVLQRMTTVQFYPFHMLLQQAPTFNALDFLPLLAGAPREEIEQRLARDQKGNRLHLIRKAENALSTGTGFLFTGDKRFFLEVLYLKLAFLHELVALVMDGATEPVNRMSMEGLGVSLGSSGARLPYFWNFRLKLLDPVGQPVGHAVESIASQSLARDFLGLAWFYVLLVNARQPMEAIHEVIDALRLANYSGQGTSPALTDPVFAPDNIFWYPLALESQTPWPTLWQEALELGVQLLHSDVNLKEPLALQVVESHLVDLKARVHQSLFQAYPGSRPEPKAIDHSADEQIVKILTGLLERWVPAPPPQKETLQVEPQQSSWPPSGIQPNEDGDYEETIILSTQSGAEEEPEKISSEPALEKTVLITPPSRPNAGIDLDKTVVNAAPSAAPPPLEDVDIEKTVVIKAPARSEQSPDPDKTVVIAAPSKPAPIDDLDKTVVIGGVRTQETEDDLAETVALKPGGRKPLPGQKPVRATSSDVAASQSNEPDDLEATIDMKPKSAKDRKPKP